MLSNDDYAWVRSIRQRYSKKGTDESRRKDWQIRRKARKAIEDLAFLAQELPEDQLKQLFTEDRMKGLIQTILGDKKDEPRDLKRQLAIADIFITSSAALWNRRGIYDQMEMLKKSGGIDYTLEHVREVLVASLLERAKLSRTAQKKRVQTRGSI